MSQESKGPIDLVSGLDYFHYPVGKTREYSKLRSETTMKYSNITTILMVVFVLLIPVVSHTRAQGIVLWRRLHLFKRLNSALNKMINIGGSSFTARLREKTAVGAKKLLYLVYYNLNSILLISFWSVILSTLSLSEIYHGDLIFVTKRLGRIVVAVLPTIFFLSLRPSPLPNVLYLAVLPIHKWLSRLAILQGVIHTIIYCGYFQVKGTWFKAWKRDNIYGWVAILGFIIIAVTSLSSLRNRYYKIFYFNHYAWSWIIVGCLQIHVRPIKCTPYTIANVIILSGQVIYRIYLTKTTMSRSDIKVIDVSPNLSYIEFPNQLIKNTARKPGAHIRIAEYHPSIFVRIYNQLIPNYHPYTLVSLPSDNYQKLILRKNNFKVFNNRKYLVSGTYDPHLSFIKTKGKSKEFSISKLKSTAKRILIVVGGSAISFALPILRVMNYEGIPVKILWVIKDYRDINILKYFDGFIHEDDFEIFITGDSEVKKQQSISKYNSIGRFSIASKFSFTERDIESNETASLLNYSNNSLIRENENENVDISVDNEEDIEEDEECQRPENSSFSIRNNESEEIIYERESSNTEQDFTDYNGEILSPTHSHKTNSSMNEPFIPQESYTSEVSYLHQFNDCVKKLGIENKIYKGRPKLNYRYYNWCINEGFTQCSGPVSDGSNNLICCKDLPKNRVSQEDINLDKIWVVSAGPQGLVKNVKLWANENGLKFHEEAFYV